MGTRAYWTESSSGFLKNTVLSFESGSYEAEVCAQNDPILIKVGSKGSLEGQTSEI